MTYLGNKFCNLPDIFLEKAVGQTENKCLNKNVTIEGTCEVEIEILIASCYGCKDWKPGRLFSLVYCIRSHMCETFVRMCASVFKTCTSV